MGRTSFVIAHRLSTIANADRVIVIDNGRIAEQGTHKELLSSKGVYYRMYKSQFHGSQGLEPDDPEPQGPDQDFMEDMKKNL